MVEIPYKISGNLSNKKRSNIVLSLLKLEREIGRDYFINFVALLKSYKILGKFIHGSIKEIYSDRNTFYFKNFFSENALYKLVKQDIEWAYKLNKDIKVTILRNGLIVYDNYKPDNFNVLLMTIHSGTWMPKNIEKKQCLDSKKRFKEEDVDTHKLYAPLVLEKAGIWIDNKFSRFACDFNRSSETAIYENHSEKWVKEIWKEKLKSSERKFLMKSRSEFYFLLGQLINTYRFNIIFDAHSMRDSKIRPNISFGTKYIPSFYMPIVRSMQNNLVKMGYSPVRLNVPYSGGYILKWLNKRFPDIFTFSMEINKKLYMTKNREKPIDQKLLSLSSNLVKIFDIE